jgi:transposase
MGMARYVVDAVVLEGRSVRDVARAHGLSKTWVCELTGRYRAGGYEALEPRSRRPRSCPHQTPGELVKEILRLRGELQEAGYDCGPATIRYHLLAAGHEDAPSRATIWQILKRQGLIVPQPQKRPICSRIRFEADLPNEMWQTDFTAWQLSDGQPAEILTPDRRPLSAAAGLRRLPQGQSTRRRLNLPQGGGAARHPVLAALP